MQSLLKQPVLQGHACTRKARVGCNVVQAFAPSAAVASTSSSVSSSSAPSSSVHHRHCQQQVGRRAQLIVPRSTALEPASSVTVNDEELDCSVFASNAFQYALDFARVSETYEVHSWMLLLGLLRQEKSIAADVLKDLGLTDLYGAWHEVLWALNASDGLTKRAFTPELSFSDRAYRIILASQAFARAHSKDKVSSEDILMALAAGDVLVGIFPDLPLKFEKVRKAVEKKTGRKYQLPGDEEKDSSAVVKSSDSVDFL